MVYRGRGRGKRPNQKGRGSEKRGEAEREEMGRGSSNRMRPNQEGAGRSEAGKGVACGAWAGLDAATAAPLFSATGRQWSFPTSGRQALYRSFRVGIGACAASRRLDGCRGSPLEKCRKGRFYSGSSKVNITIFRLQLRLLSSTSEQKQLVEWVVGLTELLETLHLQPRPLSAWSPPTWLRTACCNLLFRQKSLLSQCS